MLRDIYDALDDQRYKYMLERIETVINKDIDSGGINSQMLQRVHCVKEGINELLDLSRGLYKKLIGDVKS